jgi:hypothetical protein
VDFIAVDVLNDFDGLERLLELGVRNVPVVARGRQYVFGQNLETVAAFVGLRGTGHTPLPPDVLIEKWIAVLRAAQRYVRQIPHERMSERAVENRDRTTRVLSHHLFRIAEAFLESAIEGVEYDIGLADRLPPAGTCTTGDEIARYGDDVIGRLQDWGRKLSDGSSRHNVQTFYGPQTVDELLERSTWHSAQHARQLMHMLERYGIGPDGPLVEKDLAGLPLPEGLFE